MPRGDVTVFASVSMAEKYASSTGAKLLVGPQAVAGDKGTFRQWTIAFLKAAKGNSVAMVPSGMGLPEDLSAIVDRLFFGYNGVWVADYEGTCPVGRGLGTEREAVCEAATGLKGLLNAVEGVRNRLGRNLGPGIGNFKAGVTLLVGDKPNTSSGKGEPRPNWPFVSYLETGSSRWLASVLACAGIKEEDLYWVNCKNRNGKEMGNLDWLKELAPCQIVTLGKPAGEWCESKGLDHKKAYHPQYWKKFQPEKQYHLPKMVLKGAKNIIDNPV